jgi:hypothetical protein
MASMGMVRRAGLFGLWFVAGCGSGGSGGGPGAQDASLDVGTGAEASVDSGAPTDTGAPSDTGAGGDAPGDASDAGDAGVFGPPSCTYQSGTRLKARFYKGTEGTLIFDSMYDSMLDVRCSPLTTADGKLRCAPQLVGWSYSFDFFSDPSCTQPLVDAYLPCNSAPYTATLINGSCLSGFTNGGQFSLYQLGTEVYDGGPVTPTPGGNAFTRFPPPFGDGGCAPTNFEGSPLYKVTPVSDSMFVEGVASRTAGTGRFSMGIVTFSDGAVFCDVYGDFTDSTLNVPTTQGLATDNQLRMLPAVRPPFGFSEGTCTTPAALVPPSGTCGTPSPYTREVANCTEVATIRSVGAALDAGFEMGYSPDGGPACVPITPEAGTWNAVSAPLAPSMFGEAYYQNFGTGRLQYVDRATADGLHWRFAEAYDSQLQTNCSTSIFGGPTEFCIPFNYQAFPGFSDDKCTQPAYFITVDKSCAGGPPAGSFAWVNDTCPIKVLHVGTLLTTAVYQGDSTNCSAYVDPAVDIYACVDDVTPTLLEPMTLVTQ